MKRDRNRSIFTLRPRLSKGRVFQVAMNMAGREPLQVPFLMHPKDRPTSAIPRHLENLSQRFSVMAISPSGMRPWQPNLGKLTPRSLQYDAPVQLPPNEPTLKPNSILSVADSAFLTISKSSGPWAVRGIAESRHGPRRYSACHSGKPNWKNCRDVA